MRIALLAFLTLLSGCTTSYAVRADALAGLDGYDARVESSPRLLKSISGGEVKFDGRNLALKVQGAPEVKGEFLKLDVSQGKLLGTLRGGQPVSIVLTDLRQAQVTLFSPWKTVGLVFAIVAGIALPVLAGFGVVALGREVGSAISFSGVRW